MACFLHCLMTTNLSVDEYDSALMRQKYSPAEKPLS